MSARAMVAERWGRGEAVESCDEGRAIIPYLSQNGLNRAPGSILCP